jgi:hypothetical protein
MLLFCPPKDSVDGPGYEVNKERRHGQPQYWQIIGGNLSKAGWSWGCVSAVDCNGQTIFIADAHRDDGKRFVVRADEKLTASTTRYCRRF